METDPRQRARPADGAPETPDSYVKGRFSAGAVAIRTAFFDRNAATPRAGTLTPLQRRMESGGA